MGSHSAELTIPAVDGFELAATVFGDGPDVVIVNAATAVPRTFYTTFATYLADHGFTVVTYDYRGIGGSRPASLRGFRCQVSDWGMLDGQGVLDWVERKYQPDNIFMVGHSVGGHMPGLMTGVDRITALATLSAQSGHWAMQGGNETKRLLFGTYVVLPVLSHIFGYFPWSKFGPAEDLPKGAALQWAKWVKDPEYMMGDDSLPLERFSNLTAPVLAYSIDDDDWGTERSVRKMMSNFANVEYEHIVPAELGLEPLGHVGFFRPGNEVLWDSTLEWFRSKH